VTDVAWIAERREALARLDPALDVAHAAAPLFPWRIKSGGFSGLVRRLTPRPLMPTIRI